MNQNYKKLYKKLQAEMLYRLVKDHKKVCDKNCSISVFLMKDIYEDLLGRKCNTKEFKNFL